jgi:hypothetical protein
MSAPGCLAALAKAARTSTCLPAAAIPWLFHPLHPRLAFGLDAWVEQLALERAQAAAAAQMKNEPTSIMPGMIVETAAGDWR